MCPEPENTPAAAAPSAPSSEAPRSSAPSRRPDTGRRRPPFPAIGKRTKLLNQQPNVIIRPAGVIFGRDELIAQVRHCDWPGITGGGGLMGKTGGLPDSGKQLNQQGLNLLRAARGRCIRPAHIDFNWLQR